MELSYLTLNSNHLKMGFSRLLNHPFKPKTSYKINRLWDVLESEIKRMTGMFQKLLDTYCEKDEKDKLVRVSDGWKIKDDCKEAYEKDFTELMGIKFNFDTKWELISLEEIQDVNFTPNELKAIEPFLKKAEVIEIQPQA